MKQIKHPLIKWSKTKVPAIVYIAADAKLVDVDHLEAAGFLTPLGEKQYNGCPGEKGPKTGQA